MYFLTRCLLECCNETASYLGVTFPKKAIWEDEYAFLHFHASLANCQNSQIIKNTALIPTKLCTVTETTIFMQINLQLIEKCGYGIENKMTNSNQLMMLYRGITTCYSIHLYKVTTRKLLRFQLQYFIVLIIKMIVNSY